MSESDDMRPGEIRVAWPEQADAALLFIGHIRTPWTTRADCPRRGDLDGPPCRIEVHPHWADALEGVEPGATLQVLYWMHLARRDLVRQAPRGRSAPIGAFAIRSPVRPNPIASSMVRVVAREGATLVVHGLDCVDGTPLIDLKPATCPVSGG